MFTICSCHVVLKVYLLTCLLTLPIKDGGLGIRRVASLALPAFLASAAGTLQLQDHMLASTHISDDPLAESLKSRWEATFGPSPAAQSAHRQSSWDRPGILAAITKVEEARSSPFQRAGLLAARAPHSGDWLFSLPISACGLRMYVWLWLCVLALTPAARTLVAVAPTSTRQGSIVWYADTRRAVLPDIMH